MPSKTSKRKSKSATTPPTEKLTDSMMKVTQNSAIIEALFGNSDSMNVSRKSEGKRRSLHLLTDSQETNVEDESESEIRQEEEKEELCSSLTSKNKLAQKAGPQKDKQQKDNAFLSKNLSPEELETHYSQCIQLFSKNKVNAKNAFKLQLIDCMKIIMDKKSEKSENLTLMSCTLDASAKIYSCRVDNVYTNMLKFVKNYQGSGKQKKSGEKEEGSDSARGEASSDEENSGSAKKKKKEKKMSSRVLKSFVKEPDSFSRKEIKMCYYRQNLPKRQTYFLESAFLGEGYELALNRPLFPSPTANPTQRTTLFLIESIWKNEVVSDTLVDQIPGYQDLRSRVFLADDDDPEQKVHQTMENSFTFDPSVESIAEMRPFNEYCDGQSVADGGDVGDPCEIELDYDDCEPEQMNGEEGDVSAPCVERSLDRLSVPDPGRDAQSRSISSLQAPAVSFTPVAMSRMLRSAHSRHSDYSYFDDSKLTSMPAASHWKIKSAKRSITAVGKTPNTKARQNKKSYIDYTSLDQMQQDIELLYEDNKQTFTLCIKTTKDWFYNKDNLIFKPILIKARKHLLSFYKEPDTCILNVVKIPESNGEEFGANDSVLLNPQGFVSSNHDSIDDYDDRGDDHHGDYHPLEDWSEKMDNPEVKDTEEVDTSKNPDENLFSGVQNLNATDSLVPVPMKVEKVCIKFAKAQKRIDIKKLKKAIWNLLDLENSGNENKENERGRRTSGDMKKKEVNYSQIYNQIPSNISKEAAAELSYPLAFMAILHMANEKNLRLVGNQDHSDFTVALESIS